MKRPLHYMSLFFICLTIGCKSQQYTAENLPEKQLVFGNGGGITGASDTYTLLENGQLFHSKSFSDEHQELESISKKEAKTCFEQVDALNLSEMDFDYPGNLYYFIQAVNGDEKHKVTWGSNDQKVADECQEFYKQLSTITKDSRLRGNDK